MQPADLEELQSPGDHRVPEETVRCPMDLDHQVQAGSLGLEEDTSLGVEVPEGMVRCQNLVQP